MRRLLANQAALEQNTTALAQVPFKGLRIAGVRVFWLLAIRLRSVAAGGCSYQCGDFNGRVGNLLSQVGDALRSSEQLVVLPEELALGQKSLLHSCWVHSGLIVLLSFDVYRTQTQKLRRTKKTTLLFGQSIKSRQTLLCLLKKN